MAPRIVEMAEGASDEIAVGHLVGVKHDHEVRIECREHGVELRSTPAD